MGAPAPGAPRIALLAQDAFTKKSGIARYQAELIRWLAPRTDLSLLVPGKDAYDFGRALPPEVRGAHVCAYGTVREAGRSAPSTLWRLARNLDLLSVRPSVCLNNLSSRLFCGAHVDRNAYALVHGTGGFLPDSRGPSRRVVTVHDTTPVSMPERHTPMTRGLFLRPRELRADDEVVVGTESALEEFRKVFDHPAERTHVVAYGFDPSSFEPEGPKAPAPAPYILSVGAIEPRKNLVRGLQAFERFARSHEGVRWRLAGPEAWGAEEFKAALSMSDVRDRVDLLGPVPEEELAPLYRGALCVLFPSLWEGFGYPVLEAVSCGTPVAASDIPSLREAGGGATVTFDPTDAGAIAEALEVACFDASGRAARRERGIAHARGFSWSACARGHLAVYAKALGVGPDDLLAPGANNA